MVGRVSIYSRNLDMITDFTNDVRVRFDIFLHINHFSGIYKTTVDESMVGDLNAAFAMFSSVGNDLFIVKAKNTYPWLGSVIIYEGRKGPKTRVAG